MHTTRSLARCLDLIAAFAALFAAVSLVIAFADVDSTEQGFLLRLCFISIAVGVVSCGLARLINMRRTALH